MAEFVAVAARQLPPWLVSLIRGSFWWGLDMLFVVIFFWIYFVGRSLPPDRVDLSTQNAMGIIDLEKALRIFWEPAWQQAAMKRTMLVDAANFTYLHLHMPVLITVSLFAFLADSKKYRLIRNALLLSAFLAWPVYAGFPVTPPRLMEVSGYPIGMFDTIPDSVRASPGQLANWYAAVPSYHFGWLALCVGGVWWCWKNWMVRVGSVVFASWMWWSIVVTGNHYFLDMLAGVAMVSLAFALALKFERWAQRNPEKAARFTIRAGPLRLPF
jgi:membrane-associated phospholipid phosphatase